MSTGTLLGNLSPANSTGEAGGQGSPPPHSRYGLLLLVLMFSYVLSAFVPSSPAGTEAVERTVDIDGNGTMEERDVLILGKGKKHRIHKTEEGDDETVQPTIRVTRWRTWAASMPSCCWS